MFWAVVRALLSVKTAHTRIKHYSDTYSLGPLCSIRRIGKYNPSSPLSAVCVCGYAELLYKWFLYNESGQWIWPFQSVMITITPSTSLFAYKSMSGHNFETHLAWTVPLSLLKKPVCIGRLDRVRIRLLLWVILYNGLKKIIITKKNKRKREREGDVLQDCSKATELN